MKIKEITISRSVKLSWNYNSVGSEISLTAEVGEGEDVEKVYNELKVHVELLLSKDISNQIDLLGNLKGGNV